MDNNGISELVAGASKMRRESVGIRKGQALMNILYSLDVDLYNRITGTEADVFYVDNPERLDAFFGKVMEG